MLEISPTALKTGTSAISVNNFCSCIKALTIWLPKYRLGSHECCFRNPHLNAGSVGLLKVLKSIFHWKWPFSPFSYWLHVVEHPHFVFQPIGEEKVLFQEDKIFLNGVCLNQGRMRNLVSSYKIWHWRSKQTDIPRYREWPSK